MNTQLMTELGEMYSELELMLSPYEQASFAGGEEAALARHALIELDMKWKAHRRRARAESENGVNRELEKQYQTGIDRIASCLKSAEIVIERESAARRSERIGQIAVHIAHIAPALTEIAPVLANSPAFLDHAWLRPNCKDWVWRQEVKKKVKKVKADLQILLSSEIEFREALLNCYIETCDLSKVSDYRRRLMGLRGTMAALTKDERIADRRQGRVVAALSGNVPDLRSLMSAAEQLDVRWEMLEDAMPGSPTRMEHPPLDFVAVDLETTGSLGAKKGDGPAQITEIGAVKVIDGRIVERFDLLVDPERDITDAAKKITHITNEMVRGQPKVAEGIERLLAFAGDLPWVGHDFLANDMPLIQRIAMPAGITVAPKCFDTFAFAFAHKEEWSLEGLSLKALSEQFEIPHGRLHRAVEDAEVTAYLAVYMANRTNDKHA